MVDGFICNGQHRGSMHIGSIVAALEQQSEIEWQQRSVAAAQWQGSVAGHPRKVSLCDNGLSRVADLSSDGQSHWECQAVSSEARQRPWANAGLLLRGLHPWHTAA